MKILVTGRTGAGKTTLANALAPLIGAVVFDGDAVRALDPNPIGFTHHDRWLHAKRMSGLCDAVVTAGGNVIGSFCCPTNETRAAFRADFVIYCAAMGDCKWLDTNAIWEDPGIADLVTDQNQTPSYWAEVAAGMIQPVFNPMAPTALLVGRYQPFHGGHKALAEEALHRHGQVCFGVRDHNRDWSFPRVKGLIDHAMRAHTGKFTVIPLPNITAVCYGRDVGYGIEHIDLPKPIQDISATKIRASMALKAARVNDAPLRLTIT